MKKILFTTDFSANANKAFYFALNMAEKHNAELILAHVFDVPNVYNYPIEYNPSEMKPGMIKDWKRTLSLVTMISNYICNTLLLMPN